MLYALTLETSIQAGLWCQATSGCDFTYGGMFTTTTVQKVLFNGYTEPSIMRYYDLKFSVEANVDFECVNDPYDYCGFKNYKCDEGGLKIKYPITNSSNNYSPYTLTTGDDAAKIHYNEYIMKYGQTQVDEYFAEYLIYNLATNKMLWPDAMDATVAQESQAEIAIYSNYNYTTTTGQHMKNQNMIVKMLNPFWQAYAGWDRNDTDFLKYYKCQNRVLNGPPGLFQSCENSVYTGRDYLNHTLNLKMYHGNDTIYQFADSNNTVTVNGTVMANQFPMYLWDGFVSYPYTYAGREKGVDYATFRLPDIYSKMSHVHYTLSQSSLLYSFQREIAVTMPLPTRHISSYAPVQNSYGTRRFVEDKFTWRPYEIMGTPKDSYGQAHKIPIGMANLERFAGFPIYVDTPHSYGNLLWGGIEYTFVSGTVHNQYGQRTFIDYDPVVGKALRMAVRQQITVRVEANAMFPVAFSSQQRCIVPTKTYALSSGYGCFAYIPLLWYEEASILRSDRFFQLNDHYYTRPGKSICLSFFFSAIHGISNLLKFVPITERGNMLTIFGIVLGAVFILVGLMMYINEEYHRRRFYARVYVD
jgi:hypothetical protein